jgi:hypothetical protein
MRQFLIDEIPRPMMKKIEAYLESKAQATGLERIFWLPLPESLLSPTQKAHQACGPHYLAIETGRDFVKFEYLVRCRNRFRCDCIAFATPEQETFLLDFARALIRDLAL